MISLKIGKGTMGKGSILVSWSTSSHTFRIWHNSKEEGISLNVLQRTWCGRIRGINRRRISYSNGRYMQYAYLIKTETNF